MRQQSGALLVIPPSSEEEAVRIYNNNYHQQQQRRPIFWDTQNKSKLILPTVDDDGIVRLDHIWAHPGIGCNAFELSALMKIITAHETYMDTKQSIMLGNSSSSGASIPTEKQLHGHLRTLSVAYRSALRDCLSDWELSFETNIATAQDDNNEDTTKNDKETDLENFELLQIVHSIMHISDVFLPLLPSSYSFDYHIDPYQKPGIATAATVRYLRYHHLGLAEDMVDTVTEPEDVTEMLQSSQPEHYRNGTIYWDYIRQLVLRGCLDEAWKVLSKHSLYVTACTICQGPYDTTKHKNPMQFAQMTEIYQGFAQLKELMMRAPLPGGRNDLFDDDDDDTGTATDHTAFRMDEEVDEAILFLDGLEVHPSDYKFWDMDYSDIDFPILFNDRAAVEKFRLWNDYVKELRRHFLLSRRIGEIDSILAILSGDFCSITFRHWAQQVCAELLYLNPDYRPIQIGKRTKRVVDQFRKKAADGDNEDLPPENTAHTDAVVNIMEGDAAVALVALDILGGGAGAALPATLMALLYNLFVESSILTDDLTFRTTEFLSEASSAIVSSLSKSNNPDLGVQLAVRLLLPYTVHERNDELVATISNTLDHYYPTSDTHVDTLLSYLVPLTELKSIQIVESSVSILLCLYRRHKESRAMGPAVRSLLTGMELETSIMKNPELGLCYKLLSVDCHQIALALLRSLEGLVPMDVIAIGVAKDIVSSFEQTSFDTSKMDAARLLVRVVFLVQNLWNKETNGAVAKCIVSCLERYIDSDGCYRYDSTSTSHYYLLKLACQLIESFDSERGLGFKNTQSFPFSVSDITTFSECLTVIMDSDSFPIKEKNAMHRILGQGLSYAFIAENAQKREREILKASSRVNIDAILSPNLPDDVSIQEEVVRRMLDSYQY